MIVRTKQQFLDWTKSSTWPREADRIQADEAGLYYPSSETCALYAITEKLPGMKLEFLANLLTDLYKAELTWSGGTVWFTGWGIWGDQAVGYRIVENLRFRNGVHTAFSEATVYDFREDEFHDCAGVLLQALIFGWDTWYIPRRSAGLDRHFVFISHDGYVDIVTPDKSLQDELVANLGTLDLGFQPRQAERYKR